MQVYIDCDHHGVDLKKALLMQFSKFDVKLIDLNFGIEKPYPLIASNMARQLLSVSDGRGILICNSGIGMSIVANKYMGIYANCCNSREECTLFRKVNNGNLLCLGTHFLSDSLALDLVKIFLNTDFDLKNEMRIKIIESLFEEDKNGNKSENNF